MVIGKRCIIAESGFFVPFFRFTKLHGRAAYNKKPENNGENALRGTF